ncbi:phosphoribosylglycinamide formyltransferase [Candidatus Methylacidithermus pantelleriae]|uniref:Phosphoribosylglycinamide formyltransferase n=1 Tax=Candidatus Methylacidithermus pantelleriae TaxID=2744239 RepID=A0A8J2FRQ8_9BACT|nr:phosphoribosylglycinamide formyltransferase [Candidatus Methylacidithermus pantelleriae]CAF0693048.1 Phosphoribosylglycinamide formyltransferase [Candidatus Methylacidithermus pantelleriae]
MGRYRLAVLGSGKGSNFVAIARAIAEGRLDAEIALVVSDRPEAGILEEARRRGIATCVLPPSRFHSRLDPEVEEELARMLKEKRVDLVVLAGFMRILKSPLLTAFPNRIVNIHPSLLPAFKGRDAWRQAWEAKVPVTGCTVHWVTAELDAGPILGQREVPVLPEDTPETLHARIQEAEHELYPEVLQRILEQWTREKT